MTDKTITFRHFFDTLHKKLEKSDKEDLCAILVSMAEAVSPDQREAFLKRLEPVNKETFQAKLRQEDLLLEVDDFLRSYKDRMNRADEMDEYPEDYYDDEDTLGFYAEFVPPLEVLLSKLAKVLEMGRSALALKGYEKLFKLFTWEDDYGRGIQLMDLDTFGDEAVHRYFRALYEATPLSSRPATLFSRMLELKRTTHFFDEVKLEDLMEISSTPLPEMELFLKQWKDFLMQQKEPEADKLLREAIGHLEGVNGLAALAQQQGLQRPHAYLDWIKALSAAKKFPEVIAASQEALNLLPVSMPIRSKIADKMYEAAHALNDHPHKQHSRWEALASDPNVNRLLALHQAVDQNERPSWMKKAAAYLTDWFGKDDHFKGEESDFYDETPECDSQDVLVYAHLLAGNWKAAKALAEQSEALGWSSTDNAQGIVVPAFLVLLAGKEGGLPDKVARLWRQTIARSMDDFFPDSSSPDEIGVKYLEMAYGEALKNTPLPEAEGEAFLSWCLEIMERRLELILAHKHRRSYDRAALLLVACAEVLRALGQAKRAEQLIQDFRTRYNAFSAFQRELRSALA